MSSSSDLNVWTVLWVGDKPWKYNSKPADRPKQVEDETRLYKPADVVKFQRMAARWLPEAKFRCLSNVPVPGVECIPLTLGFEGWWPKVELWRPDLPAGRNVYFDLDTLIIRNPAPIVRFDAPFAAIMPGRGVGSGDQDDPLAPEPWKPWKDQEGFWRVPRYQTSVMVWDTAYVAKFWQRWTEPASIMDESGFSSGAGVAPDWKGRLASDQDFLGEQFPDEARMPTDWFRKMPRNGRKPVKPRMVVMTMPMRNDEAARQHEWVRQLWH